MKYFFAALFTIFLASSFQQAVFALEVQPFATKNMQPLAHMYGLQRNGDVDVAPPDKTDVRLTLDIANNFNGDSTGNEAIFFDGETYRYDLSLRRGLSKRWEAGANLVFIDHSGGNFDSFIESFHEFFGMPDGGRPSEPQNNFKYRYVRNGDVLVDVDSPSSGLGDLSFMTGYQLVQADSPDERTASVRVSLKLPTGDADDLHGSGSTDIALTISGNDPKSLDFLNMTCYGEAGVLAGDDGNVLPAQRRNVVGFGMVGIGWKVFDVMLLKVQVDAHTPFYTDSTLEQLAASAIQVTMGGTAALPDHYFLDIGVVEEIVLDTVPDVVFHFSLRKTF